VLYLCENFVWLLHVTYGMKLRKSVVKNTIVLMQNKMPVMTDESTTTNSQTALAVQSRPVSLDISSSFILSGT